MSFRNSEVMDPATGLPLIADRVTDCRACPRLVEWRERIGREKRRAYLGEDYWARPVPGFGESGARLLILGLAPAAHGANRTGRMFTGDRSGDWLYAALHRAGLASTPVSVGKGDGLRLHDTYVTAAVKCAPPANRPSTEEAAACQGYLLDEIRSLPRLRVILCLGGFAWAQGFRALGRLGYPTPRPRPKFGHGHMAHAGSLLLIGSYHPSQQNTFTGRLTREMLDEVVGRARLVASGG